jgi:hypothetical protein
MTRAAALLILLAGCQETIQAGGSGNMLPDDDPLKVADTAQPGSLDALHRDIIQPSCASTAGACHAGQFEPNLSTPALFYANLVARPGLEHPKQLRVVPGDAAASLLVDKLRNRNVGTQMPLGAPPLVEAKLALIEQWIKDGALRRPGAEPAPKLNNPPVMPEIAIYDAQSGLRLDGEAQVEVSVGQVLVLRHSVDDYETGDAEMPFAGFFLNTDNDQVLISNGQYPAFGEAKYDAAGPMGKADVLNWQYQWTVPATLKLRDQNGVTRDVPAAGQMLTLAAYYVDSNSDDAMASYAFRDNVLKVAP